MILEGGMLVIATTCQTVFHPHYAFQGNWHDANFGMGRTKTKAFEPNRASDGFELLDKSNTAYKSSTPYESNISSTSNLNAQMRY
jgi:hypothetical protein